MSLYMAIPTVSKSPLIKRAAQQKRTLDVDPKRNPQPHTYLNSGPDPMKHESQLLPRSTGKFSCEHSHLVSLLHVLMGDATAGEHFQSRSRANDRPYLRKTDSTALDHRDYPWAPHRTEDPPYSERNRQLGHKRRP